MNKQKQEVLANTTLKELHELDELAYLWNDGNKQSSVIWTSWTLGELVPSRTRNFKESSSLRKREKKVEY